jgi:hypothetical protein
MKISKRPLVVTSVIATAALLLAATSVPAQAFTPVPGPPPPGVGYYQVIAGTYFTAGAGATVGAPHRGGAVLAGTYITTGTNVTIGGHTASGAATTFGAGGIVHARNQAAECDAPGTDVSVRSGAATTIGAGTVIVGTVQSGAATTGAGTNVCPPSGGVPAASGVPTLAGELAFASTKAKTSLAGFQGWGTSQKTDLSHIPGTVATDLNFKAGTHYIPGFLSNAANTVITLDATDSSLFKFHISSYLSFGAGTTMNIINPNNRNVSINWYVGGYASLGANATVVGDIYATGYVSTGLNSAISCGGKLHSEKSYVTLGANSTVLNSSCG